MASSTSKVNILVVDDLPEKLLAFNTILEELNENVVTVQSGREALRRLLDQDFAVILLDVNMPDMDGFETATLIRQRRKSEYTPIIFITAFADELNTSRGYSLGAVDFILAPVVPEVLRSKVRVFVDLFRKTEQVKKQAEERILLAREQAARAAAEEATRRATFLAEATSALASSLDHKATLRSLLELMVPALGDLGVISQIDDRGRLGQTDLAWVRERGLGTQTAADPRDLAGALKVLFERVVADGKPEYLPCFAEISGDAVVAVSAGAAASTPPASSTQGPDESIAGAYAKLKSAVVLPLQVRGRMLGVFALAMGSSSRRFEPADLALIGDLAQRAAIALDNARLYHDVQEADRRKNEFLAMLAHELRNPLAPIRSAVEIMALVSPDVPDLRWARDVIERQVQHMVRLVDDLLDLSRITRGKIKLQLEEVNVATVVDRALETCRPLMEARKHQLTLCVSPEPLYVRGDAARLAQILGNLLNNAAKYTEERGQIYLTAVREGEDVVLRVRDTGLGIPPEMLTYIFDLFTQVDRSLDRSQGGLGIGLTLVRRLVELHGGSVHAFSAGPNQGSEFVVRLPLLRKVPMHQPSVNGAHPSPVSCPGCRILVVDDNMDAANSLARLLQMSGHEVEVAYDGPSAIQAAEAGLPDLILLDIGLPGMDGYEVARHLRQQPPFKDVPLVAVSGYARDEDRLRSRQAGFDHHLVKPVDPQVLPALLASLLKQPSARAGTTLSGQ